MSRLPDMIECSACLEQVLRTTVIDNVGDCRHYYCEGCVENMVRLALGDRSLYPPGCCGVAFTHATVLPHLPSDLAAEYKAKLEEYDDLHPVYCHDRTCSTYLGADKDGVKSGTCSTCKKTTCIRCRKAWHEGDCSSKDEDDDLRALAHSQGWQACRRCERLVEKFAGCNHITCVCRAQFCYLCGSAWKTCTCPQFDEQVNENVIVAVEELQALVTAHTDMLAEHIDEVHRAGDEAGIDLRRIRHNLAQAEHEADLANSALLNAQRRFERDAPSLASLPINTAAEMERLHHNMMETHDYLLDLRGEAVAAERNLRRAGYQHIFDRQQVEIRQAIAALDSLVELQRQRLTEDELLAVADQTHDDVEDTRFELVDALDEPPV